MIDSAYLDALQIHGAGADHSLRKGTSGFGSPAPRRDSLARARRHGEDDRTRYYAGRVFNLRGYSKGATPADAWDAFDALKNIVSLNEDVPRVFKFTRSGRGFAERALVRVASELVEDPIGAPSRRIGWTVQLVAQDPRLYADALTSVSYDPASTTYQLDTTVGGNYFTEPVWTIHGPVTGGAIVNLNTGERVLELADDLIAGDVLVIDFAARTVLLNGASRPDLIDAVTMEWPDLIPGANSFLLIGTDFGEATTNLIPNGDFEIDASGWITAFFGGATGAIFQIPTVGLYGDASLLLVVTNPGDSGCEPPAITVSPSTTYTFSAWVKGADGAAGVGHTYVRKFVGDVDITGVVPLTGAWQRIVGTFTTGAAETSINLRIMLPLGGNMFIDGVQLEANNHATAFLPTNGASASRAGANALLQVDYRDARI